MIFAKTIDAVLSGRKTQTLRLAYAGDHLGLTPDGRVAVFTKFGRPRWIVGNDYAVQRERCRLGDGRICVTYLREVADPLGVDDDFVNAEGFDTVGEFFRVWKELHPTNPVQRCWAIGFERVE